MTPGKHYAFNKQQWWNGLFHLETIKLLAIRKVALPIIFLSCPTLRYGKKGLKTIRQQIGRGNLKRLL
jgi:hypothetical protein